MVSLHNKRHAVIKGLYGRAVAIVKSGKTIEEACKELRVESRWLGCRGTVQDYVQTVESMLWDSAELTQISLEITAGTRKTPIIQY